MKRGKSKQDVQTDPLFVKATEKRFGLIGFDLAASAENAQTISYFTKEHNSLIQQWHKIETDGVLWLNPEFSDVEPWVQKCAAESSLVCKPILCLVPASVGANWWRKWVMPSAHVIQLNGRLTFVGHTQAYPKDLALLVYYAGLTGVSIWQWQK